MENINRNPYSKQNKHRRQHQPARQAVGNIQSEGNGGDQGMTSSVSRATYTMDDNTITDPPTTDQRLTYRSMNQ
jgi:hypothetical protein